MLYVNETLNVITLPKIDVDVCDSFYIKLIDKKSKLFVEIEHRPRKQCDENDITLHEEINCLKTKKQ